MNKSPKIQAFCNALWDRREQDHFTQADASELSRSLIEAAFADVKEHPAYVPGADGRFVWALAVIDRVRFNDLKARVSGDLEAMAAFLLERREDHELSGRELAAGLG